MHQILMEAWQTAQFAGFDGTTKVSVLPAFSRAPIIGEVINVSPDTVGIERKPDEIIHVAINHVVTFEYV